MYSLVCLSLLCRDKERYVRCLGEEVEGHLNVTNLRSAYGVLKKFHSKSTHRVSSIRAVDGGLLWGHMAGQQARWAPSLDEAETVARLSLVEKSQPGA